MQRRKICDLYKRVSFFMFPDYNALALHTYV